MPKAREGLNYYRKYVPTMSPQPIYHLTDDQLDFSNKQRFQTMESRYSKAAYLNEDEFTSSSRIAGEQGSLRNNYESFETCILKKVECIEEETNQLLQRKERQIYFLKIQLRSNEERLKEAESFLKDKDQEIGTLKQEIAAINRRPSKNEENDFSRGFQQLVEQNQKLKDSLKILIEEKNESSKWQNKRDHNAIYSPAHVLSLKREVEELRTMVTDMENMVYNCPSCFTLRREIQELSEAYNCLVKEHSELKKVKIEKEQNLLMNITHQIQENQNILRENGNLREERGKKSYFKPKRERLNDSVAKRCRTLTDQF